LKPIVSRFLDCGTVRIALSFTPRSFLYSKYITVLAECLDMINRKDGVLAIIQPNNDMLDTLKLIGLDKVIRITHTEEELFADTPAR